MYTIIHNKTDNKKQARIAIKSNDSNIYSSKVGVSEAERSSPVYKYWQFGDP